MTHLDFIAHQRMLAEQFDLSGFIPALVPYNDFIAGKHQRPTYTGFDVAESAINPKLFKFQNAIVRWSLKLGKSAIFAAAGLGKTFLQLEWSKQVVLHTNKPVIIFAPLGVTAQTVREGLKFAIEAFYAEDKSFVLDDLIYISNYERLEKFDPSQFGGVALDESSVLKGYMGVTKQTLVEVFKQTPYKLCCSATPAPNDHVELGNHAEFLDVMASGDMLTRFFTTDTAKAQNLRLKKHAKKEFWKWVTSWAVCITKPRDLGMEYDMPGYDLPKLNLISHVVGMNQDTIQRAWDQGKLLPDTNPSSVDLGKVKRESLSDRIEKIKEVVASIPEDKAINIWCHLNDEADALQSAFPSALEVRGSDSAKEKERKLLAYADGENRMMITKPSIAGQGMNWQHCHNPIFFSPTYSLEDFFQAIWRNLRYGQEHEVNCHIIYSENEGSVIDTLQRKQAQFEEMQAEMAEAMREHGLFRDGRKLELVTPDYRLETGKGWQLHLGDCVTVSKTLPDNSIDFSVSSPPFSSLYTYSESEFDMGNAADDEEFFKHYKYLIGEMYRITKVGRNVAVHCKDLSRYASKTGATGIYDFSGDIIRAFHEFDKPDIDDYDDMRAYKTALANWKQQPIKWQYHSRITIWKDPVDERAKTNADGLLHKSFKANSAKCRVGLPDYLLIFRKWEDGADMNQYPVQQKRVEGDYIGTLPPDPATYKHRRNHKEDALSIATWQKYASPVWYDINQMNVLNYQVAKDVNDEKHLCALQLDVIERAIDLYSMQGETVFTPFAGVGSELYSALKMKRKAIGIELKESYFNTAIKHLRRAEIEFNQPTLFDLLDKAEEGQAI